MAAQLLAVKCGVDAHPAPSCVHVGAGVWASLSAARMTTGVAGATAPTAVTILDVLTSLFGKSGVQSRGALLALSLAPLAPAGS